MDILFINPRYDETSYRYKVNKLVPPLGIATLSSVLRNAGHALRILDMEAVLMEYQALRDYLRASPPDLVGIHCTTPVSHYAARCAAIVAETCPDATLIVGGPHPTLLPDDTLSRMPQVDYLLRGEAEHTLCDLVQRLGQGDTTPDDIPGIGFRRGDEMFISPKLPRVDDLDSLPLPSYDLLPLEAYFHGNSLAETGAGGRAFTMMTSRGCPYHCIFCSAPTIYGHKFRMRSPEHVVREMKLLVDTYQVGHLVFYDACFGANRAHSVGICEKILEENIQVTWRVRMRADRVDAQLLALMRKAGCTTVAFGVETGTQRLLDVLEKNETIADIEQGFRLAKEAGLWTVGYFMFGVPGETRQDSYKTVEFAKRLDPDWALFTHATPLPKTKLAEMARDHLLTKDWSNYKFSANSPVISYDGMSEDEMRELMNYAFQHFYLREEWLNNRLAKVHNPVQRERIINSFFYYFHQALASGTNLEPRA